MIYLPETMKKWPWARAINPYYEEISAQSKADFHALRPFNPTSQYAFDKCDFEHLRIGCDLMNVFFIIDEYTDVENVPMVREMIDIVIDALDNPHKKRPEGEIVLGEIVRRFWELTLRSATPNAVKHFLDCFTDYLESVVEQAEDRESDTPLTIDGYLKMRRRNIGIRPSFMPAELGLNLPDEAFYHPVVQELQYLIAELVFLDNDMVSYNKEQATGDSCHNILTVAMRQFNTDLQAALAWLYEHHAQVQARFLDALKRVPSFGPQVDPQLERYISGMAIWPRCNDSWNFESGRYFGDKGLEIQKSRWVPMLPKVERDPMLRADNVRVLLVEL
ncbi:isoprenoid synthase domain-containing protein [Mycena rosella]|uniref:Terpene synthase n=1 Tax=Mycena rosella TaxID=1033263 RepID=A0AAD7GGT0_MYCRO|nr:isoprenoid synthase domain-containing protein [Mycena rosella]